MSNEQWDRKVPIDKHWAIIGSLHIYDNDIEYICVDDPDIGLRTIKSKGKTEGFVYDPNKWTLIAARKHARDNGAVEFQEQSTGKRQ